ncbi:thiol reductant ABC exporter subunit CydD [Natronospira bacteriovora]|uniref:Thiol reductant ABC exporter subunit CydD n=1 Tax=Natronospira bacteriovora TaxID=3069753 RepID=A0ABU0W347_9GAMM|nr:thiol reductant ABC exporter subunit CydD [Natronospira sp. AB-CW4]MDQ2068399.1 thiol reductant ABC exporter subunit CydD [Natronospira sp. AB-CW4]
MTPDEAAREDLARRSANRADAHWLTRQAPARQRHRLTLLVSLEAVWLILFLLLLAQCIAYLATDGTSLGLADDTLRLGLVLLLIIGLTRYFLQRALARTVTDLAATVTTAIHRRALTRALSPAWRTNQNAGDAELGLRLSEHIEALRPWFETYLPTRTRAIVQPGLILLIAFSLDWLAGLLLLLTAPLIPLFSALIGLGTRALADQQRERLERLGAHFLDRLRALPTLRLFRQSDQQGESVAQAAEAYRRSAMRVLRVAFLSSAVLEFFSAVAIATLAIYIGLALLGFIDVGPAAGMTFQNGLMLLLLAPEFFQPLRQLAGSYHERAAAIAAVPGLRTMLQPAAASSPRQVAASTNAALTRAPTVKLDDVTIQWPEAQRPLLERLSARLEAGQWTTISGPSGCGKSTLAATLLGLRPPQRGRVLLDGRPIEDVTESRHRNALAWLGQETQLLPTSLRRNLDPGRQHRERELLDALAQVGLGDLIRQLPGGLETRLGERGAGISGGEAQRLALARSLLGRPRLLVLDEATASLDPDNEHHILTALKHLKGQLTIVFFSHSEAVAAAADHHLTIRAGGLHESR